MTSSESRSLSSLSVSVIVPCRNEARAILPFLESLLTQQTGPLRVEFLIADGMSDDGTRNLLQTWAQTHPQLKIIDNPERIVSTGLNRAIREASGEIIVRMDVHAEYRPDYILNCAAELVRTGAANVGGSPLVRVSGFRSRLFGAAYHSAFAMGGARCHDPSFEGYVDTVWCGCWWKRTLIDAGMFDESLVRNQDDELNLRISRSGGRIWQSAQIVCWYQPRLTVRRLFRQYLQYGFWKVAVIRKHRLPASWRHLVPGCFVGANMLLVCAAIASSLAGSLSAATLWLSLWAVVLATYFLAAIAGALSAGRRYGWDVVPLLPGLFAIHHVAYGLGFLLGILSCLHRQDRRVTAPAFINLSR